MMYHYQAYVHKTPKRQSILTGPEYVNEVLTGNPALAIENFRMSVDVFHLLKRKLVELGGLKPRRRVSDAREANGQ